MQFDYASLHLTVGVRPIQKQEESLLQASLRRLFSYFCARLTAFANDDTFFDKQGSYHLMKGIVI